MDLNELKETDIWELYEKGRNYNRLKNLYSDTDIHLLLSLRHEKIRRDADHIIHTELSEKALLRLGPAGRSLTAPGDS